MKYHEVAQKLIQLGCQEILTKGGQHRKWVNPQTQAMAVLPYWGSKELRYGTVKGVFRRLGIPAP